MSHSRAMFDICRMSCVGLIPLLVAVQLGRAARADTDSAPDEKAAERKAWDFESDEPGKLAKGFTNEVGRWEVVQDEGNRALDQRARNDDATFNVALGDGTRYKDVALSVRMRAVEGEVDRGGGLVWRAKDKENDDMGRYNPLRNASDRVAKVERGKRPQLQALVLPADLVNLQRGRNGRPLVRVGCAVVLR